MRDIILLIGICGCLSSCFTKNLNYETHWDFSRGTSATIYMAGNLVFTGELIAVNRNRMLLLLPTNEVIAIKQPNVQRATLSLYNYPRPALAVKETFILVYPKKLYWSQLGKFARFPQGLPSAISPSMLGQVRELKELTDPTTPPEPTSTTTSEPTTSQTADSLQEQYGPDYAKLEKSHARIKKQIKQLKEKLPTVDKSTTLYKQNKAALMQYQKADSVMTEIQQAASVFEDNRKHGYAVLNYEIFKLEQEKESLANKNDEATAKRREELDQAIANKQKTLKDLLKR